MKAICVIFSFFTCLVATFPQDAGQKLRVWQGSSFLGAFDASGGYLSSGNPTFSFQITDDSVTVPNLPCPGNPCGWYKGFWIFGDGNYKKYQDDNANLDAASLSFSNYSYPTAGTYMPVVYLTEKYTNTTPPPQIAITINLTGSSGNGVELTRRLSESNNRKNDIDFMHGLRKGYPTVFVLSHRKTDPATKVLFFYNSLKPNGLSSLTPSSILDYQKTEMPSYFFSTSETVIYSNLSNPQGNFLTTYGGTVLSRLAGKFKNCLSYTVNNPSSVPSIFEELRVFPVLKTKNLVDLPGGEIPSDSVTFTAILIGSQYVSESDPAFTPLNSTAQALFDTTYLPANLAISGSEYIRGISMQSFKVGTTFDPNTLSVSQVKSIDDGKFRVFFRMVICNQSEMPETQPTIIFNDLTGGRYSTKPTFVELSEKVKADWNDAAPWKVTLNGFQISGAPPGKESCNAVTFFIDTDSSGLQRLYEKYERAMEVCVKFSAGQGDCCKNDPLNNKALAEIMTVNIKWIWTLVVLLCMAGIFKFVLMPRWSKNNAATDQR